MKMNGKISGFASFALAALLSVSAFSACGDSGSGRAPETTASSPDVAAETTMSEEEMRYSGLPEGDFEGASFMILQYEEIAPSSGTVCVDELTGEPINDAAYERTQAVAEKLNVSIGFLNTSMDDTSRIVKQTVSAGEDTYQAVFQGSTRVPSDMLSQGYILDQNTLPGIDFSREWWNANAIDSVRLNERTYMSFGDINYYLLDFMSVLMFSKPVVEDYGLSDIYSVVDSGAWTIDAFLDMCVAAAHDLNGDGALGKKDDLIGYAGYVSQADLAFSHAADAELFSRGDDGAVKYDGVSEKYFNVMKKYSDVIGKKEYALHNDTWRDRFRAGTLLFCGLSVGELSMMRDLEFDYGIAPFPKYDESQERYIAYVTDQMQPLAVPVTVSDTELCGAVIENMAAESCRRIRDKYFSVLIDSKYVRDEESVKNLRMLYDGDIRFEIARIYNWAKVGDAIWGAIGGKADKFISNMEKLQPTLEAAMEKTMEAVSQ